MIRARISLSLCFIIMFLSFQFVFYSGKCCHCLSSSGEHFSSGTLITDYGTEVFEVVYCFQRLPLYRDVSL